MSVWRDVCVHTCLCGGVCVHTCLYGGVCVCVYMYVCTDVCMQTHFINSNELSVSGKEEQISYFFFFLPEI